MRFGKAGRMSLASGQLLRISLHLVSDLTSWLRISQVTTMLVTDVGNFGVGNHSSKNTINIQKLSSTLLSPISRFKTVLNPGLEIILGLSSCTALLQYADVVERSRLHKIVVENAQRYPNNKYWT